MIEDATLLICSATRIEYSALTPIMVLPVELDVDDGDILKSAIGFDPTFSLTFVIAVSSYSGSFPAYGMTKTLLAMLLNLEKVYKTGGVWGDADMGSVVVSGYDDNNMVLEDRWSSDQGVPLTRRQGFPSETMYDFSYRVPGVIRSATTCGGRSIVGESSSCANFYEWEGSGFYSAVQRSNFGGEFGLVSVVTNNWGQTRFKQCQVPEAFKNLTNFWLKFLADD